MRRLRSAVLVVTLLVVPTATAHGSTGEPDLPVAGARARLVVVGREVRGTGFRASEHVRVAVLQGGAKRFARLLTAGVNGAFAMRMNATLNRCEPTVVVAVGDEGSRASYRVPRLNC